MLSTTPIDEYARLQVLHRYRLLDTPAEDRFDSIVRKTATLLNAPISLFTLVDESRQWFKSRVGLDIEETARAVSFCAHAVTTNAPLVVEDATTHPLFSDNPLVLGDPWIAFYAGVPVHASSGEPLGAICILDNYPRSLPWNDYLLLQELAREIEVQLEFRQIESRPTPNQTSH